MTPNTDKNSSHSKYRGKTNNRSWSWNHNFTKAKLIDILYIYTVYIYVSERVRTLLTIYIIINGICMSITNCYAPTDEAKKVKKISSTVTF